MRHRLRARSFAAALLFFIAAACGPAQPRWIEFAGAIEQGQVEGIDQRPVAGAVTAILAHPQDPGRLFVATTNGGVWRTANGTDGFPQWTPLMDGLPSLSISALAFDPFDDKFVTIYAGTGRISSGGGGGPHIGIYRTEDDGATWTLIGARLVGLRIRALVAPRVPSTVAGEPVLLAATDSGVFRSTDAGTTFNNVLPGIVTSMIGDPADSTVVWAAVPQTGIFRSTDAGATWNATTPIPDPAMAATARVLLAIAREPFLPDTPLVLYAAIANGDHANVHRTEDDGASWIYMGFPITQEAIGGTTAGLFPGRQSNQHFSLAVDPRDPRRVYIGGDRQPRTGLIATASGTNDWSGRLFTGYAVVPPAVTEWRPLVGSFANGTSPHADSRFITFDALGNLLEGDDGGIYRLLSPSVEQARLWQSVNGTLRPTELYSAAWDAHNDNIIAGTQDVGSIEQVTQPLPGTLPQWRDARLVGFFGFDLVTQEGDGGTVAVDTRSKEGTAIRYTMGNNLGVFFRREYPVPTPNVTPEWLRFIDANGLPGPFGGLHTADTVLQSGFSVIPYVLNNVLANRLVIGGNALYESMDFGSTVTIIDTPRQGARIAALAYGGYTADGAERAGAVYAARGNELSLRDNLGQNWNRRFISGAAGFSAASAVSIRDIAIDPDDFRTAYLVTRDSVFRIDAAGDSAETITNITGTLANFTAWYDSVSNSTSTLELRTIEVFRVPGRRAALLVGGLGGVYRLLDPDDATATSVPIWREFGRGLPNVLVTDLRFDAADDVLVAATFGRGAWVLRDASAMLMIEQFRSLPVAERIPGS